MNKFAFKKINYLIITISVILIVLGFILMHGVSTGVEYNPDVFSFKRITLAPIISMVGFVGVIVGIMFKTKGCK